MKNNKIIHTRVPDTLYEGISKKADIDGITISDYCRKQLTKSVEYENPLHATDLLFVFAYIESNCGTCKDVCAYEVKHILDILEKHYFYLEPEMKLIFDEVIIKMERFLKNVNLFGFNDELILCFGNRPDDINFDYNRFFNCTEGKLPYR